MEFNTLMPNIYHSNFNAITLTFTLFCFLGMIGLIIFFICFPNKDEKRLWKTGGILGCSVLLASIAGICYTSDASYAIDKGNRDIVTENIKLKYDVDKVLWQEWRTPVEEASGKNIIAVADRQGNLISYRYTFDEATGEPTLLNIPDASEHKVSSVPITELLRK